MALYFFAAGAALLKLINGKNTKHQRLLSNAANKLNLIRASCVGCVWGASE